MTRFEEELRKNNFVCSECPKCNKKIWPPSNFCNTCFGVTVWKNMPKRAKLIELSSKDGKYFGIAEFDHNVKIMGIIESRSPIIGQDIFLRYCELEDVPKFVFSDLKEISG